MQCLSSSSSPRHRFSGALFQRSQHLLHLFLTFISTACAHGRHGETCLSSTVCQAETRESNRCMQKHAWSRQTMCCPKCIFSTSIQHVISTKTGAGIDSLKLAWLTHHKHWYSSMPLTMNAKSKTCVLVHENRHVAMSLRSCEKVRIIWISSNIRILNYKYLKFSYKQYWAKKVRRTEKVKKKFLRRTSKYTLKFLSKFLQTSFDVFLKFLQRT
jgi:hypothetical protein